MLGRVVEKTSKLHVLDGNKMNYNARCTCKSSVFVALDSRSFKARSSNKEQTKYSEQISESTCHFSQKKL